MDPAELDLMILAGQISSALPKPYTREKQVLPELRKLLSALGANSSYSSHTILSTAFRWGGDGQVIDWIIESHRLHNYLPISRQAYAQILYWVQELESKNYD